MIDERFHGMGTEMRLMLEPQPGEEPAAERAVAAARRYLEAFEAQISRFRPDGELSRLNADPRPLVPASPRLRDAMAAAVGAARATRGLVDPTLLGQLEREGYVDSWSPDCAIPLRDALDEAPARRPARANVDRAWLQVAVDGRDGTIQRRAGVRLDLGGVGQGVATDAVARLFADHPRFLIECGGDVVVGGTRVDREPFAVGVEDPFTGEPALVLRLPGGAVATSGIGRRIWRRPDGRVAHHLIDPSTGQAAWTGLVAATALAPTATEADALAMAALLSGPAGARTRLAVHGGYVVADDGRLEPVGANDRPGRSRPLRRRGRVPAPAA